MKKVIFGLFLVLAMTGCSDPNDGSLFVTPTDEELEMSISDVLNKNGDQFSMWVDFLKYTNYYNALRESSVSATVFCPTNVAMKKFLEWRGVNSIEEIPLDYAKAVAKVHIINNYKVSETTIDDVAKDSTAIQMQTLFESYLLFSYGYRVTEVDDAERTNEVLVPDSIFINNQARMERFNPTLCQNGNIYAMGDVIRPLAETIMEKLENDGSYSIFAEALHDSGYDKVASHISDTTYSADGTPVVMTYNYTCFAVPDEVFRLSGINDVSSLKRWLVSNSAGEETDGDQALLHYMQYHFLPREYTVGELFNFLTEGQTLIYDVNLPGQAIIVNNVEGRNVINNDITVLRSDINTRNGLIHKIDGIMPVFHPQPVNVLWDFLNSADIIQFVNAWGAVKGKGNVFSTPMGSSEEKIDLSDERRDGDFGTLTSFTYHATETKATKANFRTVGFYKEKYKSSSQKTVSNYGTYMNNYMCLNLGFAGWIEFVTPSIIAGTYKVVLHYCFDRTLKNFMSAGTLTTFRFDDQDPVNVYLYQNTAYKIDTEKINYGTLETVIIPSVTFEGSGSHTFRVTMRDMNAKTSNMYHQMYDYLEFIPINN